MNFYDRTGKTALGSRLRRLSEQMTEQAAAENFWPGFYFLQQLMHTEKQAEALAEVDV